MVVLIHNQLLLSNSIFLSGGAKTGGFFLHKRMVMANSEDCISCHKNMWLERFSKSDDFQTYLWQYQTVALLGDF